MLENNKSNISLINRSNLKINGVMGVTSLTETYANIIVCNDTLVVHGENLKAEKLSVETGELILVGTIISIKFEEKKEKQGLLKRIFK